MFALLLFPADQCCFCSGIILKLSLDWSLKRNASALDNEAVELRRKYIAIVFYNGSELNFFFVDELILVILRQIHVSEVSKPVPMARGTF